MGVSTIGLTKGFKDDIIDIPASIMNELNDVITKNAKGEKALKFQYPDWQRCKIEYSPDIAYMRILFTFNGDSRMLSISFRFPYETCYGYPDYFEGCNRLVSWNLSKWGEDVELMRIINQAVKKATKSPVFYINNDCGGEWVKVRKERLCA